MHPTTQHCSLELHLPRKLVSVLILGYRVLKTLRKETVVCFPEVVAVFEKVPTSEKCQSLLLFNNASYSGNRRGLLLTYNRHCRCWDQ